MKKIHFFSGAIALFLIVPKISQSQANTSLSNLATTTAINHHLLPGTNNSIYLGNTSKKWRQGFFYDKIGINPSTSSSSYPVYPLDIVNPAYTRGISVNNSFVGNSDHIGVYSYSVENPGWGYGVQAYGGYYGTYSINQGGSWTGSTFGVYGEATGTAGSRYGIFGFASGGTTFNAAGYFDGDVYAATFNVISDRKFKTGITPLKNSLEQLMKLKPSAYQFKTTQYAAMGLSANNQMGLIADEVKQVFPELVKEAVHPAKYDKDRTEVLAPEIKYEAVNYLGLIPVLIASVQEQQKTIAGLKSENEELKARFTELEQKLTLNNVPQKTVTTVTLNSAKLTQNNPNPFNKNTIINYYLPEEAGNAVMNISDAAGRTIKSIELTQRGNGKLILDAGQLQAGSYQYSLTIGGKLVDTKRMVLTK